ncbi:glycan-binding surface protein [Dyadobacter chenhuakuii]|uniref:Glycan-binding surface protein n=1 Tax=Dyadobacter chenhuakuii TaxID=2909339 RepID=A0ABY4XMW2_9BACT|nr:glycan-binding surface protein [Dyadobacter chenhuakuii]MCF2495082.1 glycan-binding surface protein [Dyadobacter chenhuakuii]USJ31606.1 glycan-binding surface protein [Dyadobacter chenhuakuii]
MKNKYRSAVLFALLAFMAAFQISCKEDDLDNNGEPSITYVRVTNPASSDSLLVGALQSNLIAIVGENLQDVTEIWFNDQKAVLTPTYITSKSILVSVPAMVPKEISNKMRMIFSNGRTLNHDFEVQISEPELTGMNCEYVATGGIATINGNYFYPPLTVTFAGGATGELVSVTDQIIQVRVPQGALPGQVTVKTAFGETKSDFWFRDNRNIFLSNDPFTGWWNQAYVVTKPGAGDPVAINGNYIRVKEVVSGWQWKEVAGGPPDAMGPISKNIPDEAILRPADYNLKFEVNTLKPYNNNLLKINVGLAKDFITDAYQWAPPYDTKGEWRTVTIPFNEIAASYENLGVKMAVNPNGYYTRLLFHGGGDLDADISMDNFRVVPKILKK